MTMTVTFQPAPAVVRPQNRTGAIVFDKPVDPKILGTYYKIATQAVEEFAQKEGIALPLLPTKMEGTSLEKQVRRLGIDDMWWFVRNPLRKDLPPYSYKQTIESHPTESPVLGIALLGPKTLSNRQLLRVEETILERLAGEFMGITGQVLPVLDAVTCLNKIYPAT
jgi:hypothetical protein